MITRYSLLKTATFLLFTFFVCLNAKAQAGQTGSLQIVTSKGPVMFAVEYAITPKEKAQGLMYKESVPKSTGMLFIYQTPKEITMWMKNTPVSLDMIFISNRGRVRYIEEKTEPNSTRQIHSHGKVSAVLEVVAGTVEDFGIKVGDEVILGK